MTGSRIFSLEFPKFSPYVNDWRYQHIIVRLEGWHFGIYKVGGVWGGLFAGKRRYMLVFKEGENIVMANCVYGWMLGLGLVT